jgi:hypothetical protein
LKDASECTTRLRYTSADAWQEGHLRSCPCSVPRLHAQRAADTGCTERAAAPQWSDRAGRTSVGSRWWRPCPERRWSTFCRWCSGGSRHLAPAPESSSREMSTEGSCRWPRSYCLPRPGSHRGRACRQVPRAAKARAQAQAKSRHRATVDHRETGAASRSDPVVPLSHASARQDRGPGGAAEEAAGLGVRKRRSRSLGDHPACRTALTLLRESRPYELHCNQPPQFAAALPSAAPLRPAGPCAHQRTLRRTADSVRVDAAIESIG